MATEIQTIKASQLEELTEVTDLNYVVVTDGVTSKKVKATNLTSHQDISGLQPKTDDNLDVKLDWSLLLFYL